MSNVQPVVYAIYVNEILQRIFPLDCELDQEWGKHDLFTFRIEYQKMLTLNKLTLWRDGAPVRIVWGRSPGNVRTWYGYVNHHIIDAEADSNSKLMQVTYVCIGTSKPMNSDKTRTWGQTTISYLAKAIAAEYGLRCVTTTSDWVLPYEVQASESDFKFLNRIADKTGYRFWTSGGTLYMIDPLTTLKGSTSEPVPQFNLDKSYMYLDTIRQLRVYRGDNLPGAVKSERRISGIDTSTGAPFSIKADASYSSDIVQYSTDWPVYTSDYAKSLVNALQKRSQFWMAATAELYGTSFLYPGKVVSLTGRQLNDEAAGNWIVASADHILKSSGSTDPTRDRYVTRLQLLRNSSGSLINIPQATQVTPEFTMCKLSGNLWKSVDQSVISGV